MYDTSTSLGSSKLMEKTKCNWKAKRRGFRMILCYILCYRDSFSDEEKEDGLKGISRISRIKGQKSNKKKRKRKRFFYEILWIWSSQVEKVDSFCDFSILRNKCPERSRKSSLCQNHANHQGRTSFYVSCDGHTSSWTYQVFHHKWHPRKDWPRRISTFWYSSRSSGSMSTKCTFVWWCRSHLRSLLAFFFFFCAISQ